jgi:hypothetical protein
VLKRYFVLVIALITAVVVGTATSTSAMQPQSKSTESMHTKNVVKEKDEPHSACCGGCWSKHQKERQSCCEEW